MVCFSCFFLGMCGQVHPFPKEIQQIQLSDWKDPEVKSLHGSFTPNMRCMPLQHYLAHWCAWPCYGAVVRRLGFQGSPAIFFGEAFHLHNPNGKKGPTIFWSWSSVRTSQILPPPNLLGQTFGCWGNAFGCLDCHRVESGCLELWPSFTCLSTRCCRPNSAVHWIRYGVGTRLIKSQRLLKRRDIF